MANPLLADQFINALRAEGVRVETVGNWRTHSRGNRGDGWGPINGVMIHHTVSRGIAASIELCRSGYAELPGPLCHGVIDKNGTVRIISVGRSNHAGGGDPNVLAAVKDERYGDYPPATQRGNSNGVDGNAHFYGYECINMGDGNDPWPAEQVDAIIRASAAICRAYGWTSKSVIAHREWSRDKSDPTGPGMPNMRDLRAKIQERLDRPASWNPTAPTTPTTGTPDVASPNLTVLARPENYTLTKDAPQTIYWTAENTDEPGGHAANGATVLNGGRYSATLNLTIDGLGENEVVEVRPMDGTFVGDPTQIEGMGNPALSIQRSVTINGRVNGLLAFQLISRSDDPVTLTNATLAMLSWPNPA